jgi:hypothetical protein
MTDSVLLRRHCADATDANLAAALKAARQSVDAFSRVTRESGSLIQSWVKDAVVVQSDHYPRGDVVDLRRGSQFFYHAHRSQDGEHGHLHLFWHATESGRRRYAAGRTPRWTRTAPTHLLAIGLDSRGLPTSLFTVNRWVTDGHWFDAQATLGMVDRFSISGKPDYEGSGAWLTAFVRMYRPLISGLLQRRDRRMSRRNNLQTALDDRGLELLSLVALDWAADLDTLERACARRRWARRNA